MKRLFLLRTAICWSIAEGKDAGSQGRMCMRILFLNQHLIAACLQIAVIRSSACASSSLNNTGKWTHHLFWSTCTFLSWSVGDSFSICKLILDEIWRNYLALIVNFLLLICEECLSLYFQTRSSAWFCPVSQNFWKGFLRG